MRLVAAGQDPVQDVASATAADDRLEVVDQAVGLVTGKDGVGGEQAVVAGREQLGGGVVAQVVEVAARLQADGRRREHGVDVEQVALVVADLARGVEDVTEPAADPGGHAVVDCRDLGLLPLLELHDDGVGT